MSGQRSHCQINAGAQREPPSRSRWLCDSLPGELARPIHSCQLRPQMRVTAGLSSGHSSNSPNGSPASHVLSVIDFPVPYIMIVDRGAGKLRACFGAGKADGNAHEAQGATIATSFNARVIGACASNSRLGLRLRNHAVAAACVHALLPPYHFVVSPFSTGWLRAPVNQCHAIVLNSHRVANKLQMSHQLCKEKLRRSPDSDR